MQTLPNFKFCDATNLQKIGKQKTLRILLDLQNLLTKTNKMDRSFDFITDILNHSSNKKANIT